MIARRDVEKAFRHGLQNAPVKSFMSSQLVTVDPEDSIFKVRNLMVEKDIGRIPVVEEILLGIITEAIFYEFCISGKFGGARAYSS